MAHAQHQVKIAGGKITLYQRGDVKQAVWQCRITAKGVRGYIHRSTGEQDFELAKERALQFLGEIGQRQQQNLPLKKKTFAEVAALFLKHAETQTKEGRKSDGRYKILEGTLRLYCIPFFGNRDITLIQKKDIIEYRRWRQDYWSSGPGAQRLGNRSKPKPPPSQATLKQEHTALRGVFTHAIDMGLVSPMALGFLKHEKASVEKRSPFTSTEYRQLYMFMRKWVRDTNNPRVEADRQLLRNYVLIMATSGMRKGEARQLRWRNLSTHKTQHGKWVLAHVLEGKTGERIVVCQPGAERYFNRLKKRGHNTGPDDLVFCHADGKPIMEYIGFKPMLKAAGLLKDGKGRDRTVYSLRHTYATLRLENGANVYWLKKNMGTSVTMIERHYGQTNILHGIEHETAKRKRRPDTKPADQTAPPVQAASAQAIPAHIPFTAEQLEQIKQYLVQQLVTVPAADLSPVDDDGEE
jgi:integrase